MPPSKVSSAHDSARGEQSIPQSSGEACQPVDAGPRWRDTCGPCARVFQPDGRRRRQGTALARQGQPAAAGPADDDGDILDHHADFAPLEAAAAYGCPICALFLRQVPRDRRPRLRDARRGRLDHRRPAIRPEARGDVLPRVPVPLSRHDVLSHGAVPAARLW